MAIADPFSPAALGACIPRFPTLRSQKIATLTKFLFSTNASGVGFIHVMPSLAADKPNAHYSTGAWAGTAATSSVATADVNTVLGYPNSPYTATNLSSPGAGVRGRIVSVGMRITPIMSASSMSGLCVQYIEPDHGDVNTLSLNTINNRPSASIMRVNPKGHLIATAGIDEGELEYTPEHGSPIQTCYPYSNDNYSAAGGDANIGNAVVKFGLFGTSGAVTFWVELIQHIEYIGPLSVMAQTPTRADPIGFAAVNAAAQSATSGLAGKSYDPVAWTKQVVGDAVAELMDFTGPYARAAARQVGRKIGTMALRGIGSMASQHGGLAIEY